VDDSVTIIISLHVIPIKLYILH